jgi:hypothetical protein
MLTPPLRHTHRIDPARLPAQRISAATHRVAWEPSLVTDCSWLAPGAGSLTRQRTLDLRAVERPLPWARVDAGRPSVRVRSSAHGRSTSQSDGPVRSKPQTSFRLRPPCPRSAFRTPWPAAAARWVLRRPLSCGAVTRSRNRGNSTPPGRHRFGGFLADDATMELGDVFPRCH